MSNPINRRGFLQCMAWAGTGLVCTLSGGILSTQPLEAKEAHGDLLFVQISDSHIGFHKDANPDVVGTLRESINKINALPRRPAFVVHTGDLTHLSKPAEFDTVSEMLKEVRTERIVYVPGEHDTLDNTGAEYLKRFAGRDNPQGWYSFDLRGVHFIGLVNVLNLKAGGMGSLGADQLAWLKRDVAGLSSSTPIVVFAHMPMWALYPQWGWGTDDAEQALAMLARFGSVHVLNGHIHQAVRKVEGNVTFHTALSTAYSQPAAGVGAGPGPLKVEPGRLRSVIGVTDVFYQAGNHTLAVMDAPLNASTTSRTLETLV